MEGKGLQSYAINYICFLLDIINIGQREKVQEIQKKLFAHSTKYINLEDYKVKLGVLLSLQFLDRIEDSYDNQNKKTKRLSVSLTESSFEYGEYSEYTVEANEVQQHYLSGPCITKLFYADEEDEFMLCLLTKSTDRANSFILLVPITIAKELNSFLSGRKTKKFQISIHEKISSDIKEFSAVMTLKNCKIVQEIVEGST